MTTEDSSKNMLKTNRTIKRNRNKIVATDRQQQKKEGVRVAKYIADTGHCSRRQAEELISEGRVKVNGITINSPALNITDQSVKIDNKLLIRRLQTDLWLFHKPKHIITSNNDPQGRTTLFSLLPPQMPRVVTVGRLDFNSEGLILLTNNSDLAHYLESPKTAWIRKYRVRVFGQIDEKRLAKLSKGITIDGVRYRGVNVVVENLGENNSWLEVSLTEGKNREIRKIMAHFRLQVSRLIRISFGPFNLSNLAPGEILKVNKKALFSNINSEDLKKINIRGSDIKQQYQQNKHNKSQDENNHNSNHLTEDQQS